MGNPTGWLAAVAAFASVLASAPARGLAGDDVESILGPENEPLVAVHGLIHAELEYARGDGEKPEFGFELEHVFLRVEARPSRKLEIVTELLHREDGIEVLEAFGSYEFHPAVSLRAGKFLMPFGFQDETFYCSVRWENHLPLIHRAIIPDRWADLGAQLSGRIPIGSASLGYDLVVTNGMQAVRAHEAHVEDNNQDKLLGGRLHVRADPVIVGVSYMTERYDDASRYRAHLFGGHAAFQRGGFRVRAEYLGLLSDSPDGRFFRQGLYAESAWRFDLGSSPRFLQPALRYSLLLTDEANPTITARQAIEAILRLAVTEDFLLTLDYGLTRALHVPRTVDHLVVLGILYVF
jgi:hypothetical protein